MTIKTLAAAACIAICTATAGSAMTVPTLTMDGIEYEIGFVEGTFLEHQQVLEAQPFFDGSSYNKALGRKWALAAWNVGVTGKNGVKMHDQIHFAYTYGVKPGNPTVYTSYSHTPDVAVFGNGWINNATKVTYATATAVPKKPLQAAAVSAVPLPAGGVLLLSGLAGVAALKRRKNLAA